MGSYNQHQLRCQSVEARSTPWYASHLHVFSQRRGRFPVFNAAGRKTRHERIVQFHRTTRARLQTIEFSLGVEVELALAGLTVTRSHPHSGLSFSTLSLNVSEFRDGEQVGRVYLLSPFFLVFLTVLASGLLLIFVYHSIMLTVIVLA